MLKNQDFVLISDDWGRHSFSCQHLVEQLLPFNRVIWVNTVGYRPLKFTVYDIKRSFEKISNWVQSRPSIESESDFSPNLRILDPVCLPFGVFPVIREFNGRSISRSVRKTSLSWNFHKPILITTLPTTADFIRHLEIKRIIYYCVDDFTLWPGENGLLMRELEEGLLRQADLVVATSEKLRQTRSNGFRSTALLTHGVDLQHFESVGTVPPAPEIRNLTHPVVGYFGLIDERCDLSLIATIARALVQVTILIIGPWKISRKPLENLPNVKILGKVHYSQLPAYLAPVDLLILPYHTNELAEAINPLKLKEYLATGLPVVSTPLPEVKKLSYFIDLAYNHESFVEAVGKGLTRGRNYSSDLTDFLERETWLTKAELFSDMIQEIL